MTPPIDLQPVVDFVQRLNRNNNRAWFEAHRDEMQAARGNFEDYIAILIGELSRTDSLSGVTPKDCIFRLNRDLRFSRDKAPYKPYMSAYIAPGGRKSRRLGYYVHIQAGDRSMAAGGLHEPEPRQLASWRASIDRDPAPFTKIASAKLFRKYFGEVGGESLKTAPRGYPKGHPNLDLIRLKSVTVSRPFSDSQVTSPGFIKETLATFDAMRPFLKYLSSL